MDSKCYKASKPYNGTDFYVGILLGLPFAFPIPFYWCAFLAFVIAFQRVKDSTLLRRHILLFALLFGIGIVSSMISKYHAKIEVFRMIYSSLSFLFFLFGSGVKNFRSLFRGYVLGTFLVSLYTLVLFFILKPYTGGAYMFIYDHYRNWAVDFIPDWPNLYCFNICVAGLLSLYVFKQRKLAFYFLFVALITTSRISLVYLSFVIALFVFELIKEKKYFQLSLLFIVIAFLGLKVMQFGNFEGSNQLADRLNKTADRELVFSLLLQEFNENPVIGIGNVTVEDFLGFDASVSSFHNTFLEVGVRYGAIGLIIFLVLISPPHFRGDKSALLIILFFLICSLFQNILRHPHNVMIYSSIIYYYYYHYKNNLL